VCKINKGNIPYHPFSFPVKVHLSVAVTTNDGLRESKTELYAGLKRESFLASIAITKKGEGWPKEVAVGTGFQYRQRDHDDRHQL